MAALTYVADGAGVPALIDIARNGSVGSRKSAVFWLGQTGDPRALSALHAVIENTSEDERVRSNAIFALAHGDDIPASEFAYLRGIFPRLTSNKMKEQVLMGMGEDKSNGSAWLVAKARDNGESLAHPQECVVLGRAARPHADEGSGRRLPERQRALAEGARDLRSLSAGRQGSHRRADADRAERCRQADAIESDVLAGAERRSPGDEIHCG